MTTYWCGLAWLGGSRPEEGVIVEVEDGRIASVEGGGNHPPRGARLLHGLTLPGLANAHSHAFQRVLRGRTQHGSGDFWTWREQMYEVVERLDPERYLAVARATYAEMALAGITTVGEFHYLHHRPGGTPYDDPNEMAHVLIAAAADAGIRLTLIDACYLHGGIGARPDGAQTRFSDGRAEAWAERVDALRESDSVRIGAAIHSMRAVDPESASVVAAWARERDCPLHAHVSEQPAENEACLEAYGRTPTALLADAGALEAKLGDAGALEAGLVDAGAREYGFTGVHATHLDDADVRLLGDARAWCCVCPTTERDLADGIGRVSRLAGAGATLSLGSDSNAVIDMFEEARAVELDERLASGRRGVHGAADLLQAATAGGHACLGWPDVGRIEPGMRADLVTVGLDSVRLAGTSPETALNAVVFAATATDVRHVFVDGHEIVTDGRHATIDVARELDEAVRAVIT